MVDVDADVEGERRSAGRVDVEDRNVLARQALTAADLVLVVGVPGRGRPPLAAPRASRDLLGHGVEAGADAAGGQPGTPGACAAGRARLGAGAAAEAIGARRGRLASTPVFVPERRRLAEAARDAAPLPAPVVKPLVGAVRGLLDRARHSAARALVPAPEPVLVAPGSLGSWADDGADL